MASESPSLLYTARRYLRLTTIMSFPMAMIYSVPYPVPCCASVAPAVGVIILFFGAIIAFVDLGYWRKWKKMIPKGRHEYRIRLEDDSDGDGKEGRLQKKLMMLVADIFCIVMIAIILGLTLTDRTYSRDTLLKVYASLPYFIAG
jgi:hypothetical protein